MFGIAGTAELSTFCPGTGTWNRLQDGMRSADVAGHGPSRLPLNMSALLKVHLRYDSSSL